MIVVLNVCMEIVEKTSAMQSPFILLVMVFLTEVDSVQICRTKVVCRSKKDQNSIYLTFKCSLESISRINAS